MRHMIWVVLLAVGCGESGELAALKTSLRVSEENAAKSTQAVKVKQDEAIVILKDNTASLTAIKTKIESLEASLVKSNPNGKEVIQSAPESPAKANDTPNPLKVATPGTSQSESLVELATRLYAQGVNTNNKTREELEVIDTQMNGGQAVTGAMFQNNRTGAVTSKRSAVRFVPRGSSFVQWPNYSTQSTCGPGGCPPRRSR